MKRFKPMAVRLLPVLLLCSMILAALLLLSKCETARSSSSCNGNIVVQNPIPDTTLYAHGDSLMIDLVGNPPVFVQTAHIHMSFTATSTDLEGQLVVFPTMQLNPKTNQGSILKVVPYNAGKAIVTVRAEDGCIDYWESNTFEVTVIDTTKH